MLRKAGEFCKLAQIIPAVKSLKLFVPFLFSVLFHPMLAQQNHLEVLGHSRIIGNLDIRAAETDSSIFIGTNAGVNDDGDNLNTIIGVRSAMSNSSGSLNVSIGFESFLNNIEGTRNTSTGTFSMYDNLSGYDNTANGFNSMVKNTTGRRNTAVGANALRGNENGHFNVAIGYGTLFSADSVMANTTVGFQAGATSSGAYNTMIGYNTGFENSGGSKNTYLGALSNAQYPGLTNAIAIGYNANVTCSNCATIGGVGGDAVKLGIGTDTPEKTLDIHGELIVREHSKIAVFESSGNNAFVEIVPNSAMSGTSVGYFDDIDDKYFFVNTPEGGFGEFIIRADGKTGIGVLDPSSQFQVGTNGDGTVATANAWNTFSDARWKKDIRRLNNASQLIENIHAYSYLWKDGDDQKRQIGVIAQEVEKALPELVVTDANGYKSVDYGKLSAVLIETVKEQQTRINALEKRLSAIENQSADYH